MKNIVKIIFLSLSLFIIACSSSKSVTSSDINKMTLAQYAKSQRFIKFTNSEIRELKNKMLNDNSAENHIKLNKVKASVYRFYKKCSFDGTSIKINVKNGKEINISNNIFSYIKNEIIKTNRFSLEYKSKNSDMLMEIDSTFTDDGLEFLLR